MQWCEQHVRVCNQVRMEQLTERYRLLVSNDAVRLRAILATVERLCRYVREHDRVVAIGVEPPLL